MKYCACVMHKSGMSFTGGFGPQMGVGSYAGMGNHATMGPHLGGGSHNTMSFITMAQLFGLNHFQPWVQHPHWSIYIISESLIFFDGLECWVLEYFLKFQYKLKYAELIRLYVVTNTNFVFSVAHQKCNMISSLKRISRETVDRPHNGIRWSLTP